MCWVMPPASPAATSVSADRVQQRGLAVVDVAHHRHDRRALDEVLLGVLEHRLDFDVVGGVDDLDLLAELLGDHLDRVVGERLGEGRHLAQAHQLLDHFRHRHAEVLGDVLDGGARVDTHEVGVANRGGVVDRRDRLVVGAAAPTASARAALGLVGGAGLLATRGLRVDHHAPAPGRPGARGSPLAGARVARGTHSFGRDHARPVRGGRGGGRGGLRRGLWWGWRGRRGSLRRLRRGGQPGRGECRCGSGSGAGGRCRGRGGRRRGGRCRAVCSGGAVVGRNGDARRRRVSPGFGQRAQRERLVDRG